MGLTGRKEIADWRRVHGEKLGDLYCKPENQIKNYITRTGDTMRQKRNAYRVVVGKPAGSKPRGRLRRRRENNITMDLNLLTPNVNYSGRNAPLTSKVAFYIFIQQI